MPGQHASFSPSSSERVTTCPASYGLNAGLPDQPNVYAMLGTVAHEIHERCLKEGVLATTYLGETFMLTEGEGEFELTETFVVDEEMCEAVQASVDRILDIKSQLEGDLQNVTLHVEQKIDISRWTPIPEQYGTSDTYLVADDQLHVFDYKHGEGKKVYAERNTQGALYALGVLNKIVRGRQDIERLPFSKVAIHIHQPRLQHLDTWEVSLLDFLKFGDWIRERLALAVSDNPPFNPTESACMFCKVKTTCKARAEWVSRLLDDDFEDYSQPTEIVVRDNEPPAFELIVKRDETQFTNEHLAFLRRYTTFVKKWAEDIEREVERRLLRKEPLPGWKLVEGRSAREWLDEESGRKAMRSVGIPDKEHYKIELLSPSAAEEKIKGRGKTKKVQEMAKVVRRIKGAPTVAPESDRRPAIDLLDGDLEDYTDDGL